MRQLSLWNETGAAAQRSLAHHQALIAVFARIVDRRSSEATRQRVLAWIDGDDSGVEPSFGYCCRCQGWDPAKIRAAVHTAAKRRAEARPGVDVVQLGLFGACQRPDVERSPQWWQQLLWTKSLEDLFDRRTARTKRAEILRWVARRDPGYPFSFDNCARVFGMRPQYARQAVYGRYVGVWRRRPAKDLAADGHAVAGDAEPIGPGGDGGA